ncbi:uncharacterized protein [Prorops nasuta]|uniref:uncharacterized protein isoform X2 n=1 Tax=Prorops nasuta TaxID=863751 RepID=UPI0034CF9FAE
MSGNVCITDLPSEVIGLILEYKDLSIVDLLNLSMTCKRLYYICNGQNVWKRKCFQRWTWMQKFYEDCVDSDDKIVCWKKFSTESITFIKKLQDIIHNTFDKISKYKWVAIKGEYDFKNRTSKDKTFFSKVLKYNRSGYKHMNEIYLTNKWMKLLDLPAEKQTLSKFGILAHQWLYQGRQEFTRITLKTFDNYAERTMAKLRETCPEHPIFSVSKEKLNFWRDNVIEDNQWNYIDCRKIAEALRVTILEAEAEAALKKLLDENGSACLIENLSFSVILDNTGRRLGLRCGCVIYIDCIYLKWKECCDNDSKPENVYLNFLDGGEFLKNITCQIRNPIIIEDNEYFEKIQKDIGKVNNLINDLMTSNPEVVTVKKCMEIYQIMQASYDKRSFLEVVKLKMQAAIIYKSLEKLYKQKRDSSIDLECNKIPSVLKVYKNVNLRYNTLLF